MEDLGANPRRGAHLGLLRWLLLPVVVVPLAFVLGFGFGRDPNVLPSALMGRPAPSFELPTLAGSALSSESLRGRPMVINFWASWCLECKTEHPVLMDGAAALWQGDLTHERLAGHGGARLPERAIRIGAAVAFVIFGVLLIVEGLGLVWGDAGHRPESRSDSPSAE